MHLSMLTCREWPGIPRGFHLKFQFLVKYPTLGNNSTLKWEPIPLYCKKGGDQIITTQFNKIFISTSFQRWIFAEQKISQNSLTWVTWVTSIVTLSCSCSRFSIFAILSSNSLLPCHRPCEIKDFGVLVLSNVTASVTLSWPKCTTMASFHQIPGVCLASPPPAR